MRTCLNCGRGIPEKSKSNRCGVCQKAFLEKESLRQQIEIKKAKDVSDALLNAEPNPAYIKPLPEVSLENKRIGEGFKVNAWWFALAGLVVPLLAAIVFGSVAMNYAKKAESYGVEANGPCTLGG